VRSGRRPSRGGQHALEHLSRDGLVGESAHRPSARNRFVDVHCLPSLRGEAATKEYEQDECPTHPASCRPDRRPRRKPAAERPDAPPGGGFATPVCAAPRSVLTQQAVSTPRWPAPNERRRRRPPHGRRTGTTGEWPPATRG